jgi:hypothetical protein
MTRIVSGSNRSPFKYCLIGMARFSWQAGARTGLSATDAPVPQSVMLNSI